MRSKRSRQLLITLSIVATVALVTHAAVQLLPGVFEPLTRQVTDVLFELRSRYPSLIPTYDGTIVHVDVDDPTLERLRRLEQKADVGRREFADLVRNLDRCGVALQFHDVVFPFSMDEAAEESLREASSAADTAYFGAAVGYAAPFDEEAERLDGDLQALLDETTWSLRTFGSVADFFERRQFFATKPSLARASRGLGFLDLEPDRDGVYRRLPLLVRDGERFLPSLPLKAMVDYLGVDPRRIEVRPGRSILLPDARRPGAADVRDIAIPIDHRGQMIVNYLGQWDSMAYQSFWRIYKASEDLFELDIVRSEMEDKIAITAWRATGSGDIGATPTDRLMPLSRVHANVMNNILTGEFLRRPSWLWTILLIELPLLVLLVLASRLSTTAFVFVAAGLAIGYTALAAAAFLYGGLILEIPRPLAKIVLSTICVSAYQFHLESTARAVLRSSFESYFPPALVGRMIGRPDDLIRTAERKELTVLFSDIKNFSKHTSTMDAGDVRRLLNEYFGRMNRIVFDHEGTLDKYMGDGLMVFFGDPADQPDHARRCVEAAVEMQRATRELQRLWASRGDMPLEIRIGINSGDMIVGNMGSDLRLSYTVLGKQVNMAQRLESSAPVGGILISERTNELLAGAVPTRRTEPVTVKGFDEPLSVYEVIFEDSVNARS